MLSLKKKKKKSRLTAVSALGSKLGAAWSVGKIHDGNEKCKIGPSGALEREKKCCFTNEESYFPCIVSCVAKRNKKRLTRQKKVSDIDPFPAGCITSKPCVNLIRVASRRPAFYH